MKESEISYLIANMPAIMAMTAELNNLVNNLPKDTATDLTITIGKSTLKFNSKRDEEQYNKFLQTLNENSINKIWKLRDSIDELLYNSKLAEAELHSKM